MSLIVGQHPIPMTVILVQDSSADLVVPSDVNLAAPVLEFGAERTSDTVIASHPLAADAGEWVTHLTEQQVATLEGAKFARLVDAGRTLAAGPVEMNQGWEGQDSAGVSTRIIWGGGAGVAGVGITEVRAITQADYDALTTKSPTTLYVIQ